MRVLVIEDDASSRRALCKLLEHEGHVTTWAASASGALALMRSERPEPVLLDMNLGEGLPDGFHVLREKVLDPTIAPIPTAIVSGLAPEAIRARGSVESSPLQAVLFILGKPVEFSALQAVLRHVERLARSQSETEPAPPLPEEEGDE